MGDRFFEFYGVHRSHKAHEKGNDDDDEFNEFLVIVLLDKTDIYLCRTIDRHTSFVRM